MPWLVVILAPLLFVLFGVWFVLRLAVWTAALLAIVVFAAAHLAGLRFARRSPAA